MTTTIGRAEVPSRGARLLCRTGDLAGITYTLGTETRVGRSSDCEVRIDRPFVSQRHLRIAFESDGWILEDLGSKNGTWLDGVRVHGRVALDGLHVVTVSDRVDLVFVPETIVEAASVDRAGTLLDAAPFLDPSEALLASAPSRHPMHTQLDDAAFVDPFHGGSDPVEDVIESAPTRADPARTQLADPSFDELPDLGTTWMLEYRLPGSPVVRVPLSEGRHRIGRSRECEIKVEDPPKEISRVHAVLTISASCATIEDLSSANGTFVREKRVRAARLQASDRFRLGPNIEFTVLRA